MQTGARAEKSFLVDLDTKEENEAKQLEQILFNNVGRNFFKYETKYGYHYITPPFDVRAVNCYDLQKDGLLLLSY